MLALRRCAAPAWRAGPRRRAFASAAQPDPERNKRVAMYALSVAVGTLGVAYASVPLYKLFCQATGFGGTTKVADAERAAKVTARRDAAPIRVSFFSDVSEALPWKFTPQQRSIVVRPGETALAFYTAKNLSDKAIVGVATYNVTPLKAGAYFSKVQCFCFEEQRLGPKEEVDMPVLFFLDPEMCEDEGMDDVTDICLSYTFFPSTWSPPDEDED